MNYMVNINISFFVMSQNQLKPDLLFKNLQTSTTVTGANTTVSSVCECL